MFLNKSYIWKKSCSWDIGQNALSQSNCGIFKSAISPEQIDEAAPYLACCYKFIQVKNQLMYLTDILHAGTNSC